MKSTKSKLHLAAIPLKAAKTPVARKPPTLEEVVCHGEIFDRYFAIEQQQQIVRLMHAGDFEGRTESEAIDKTIAELAAAALYALGLDPLSEDALCRLSEVVYGAENGFPADLFNAINDRWQTAEIWTKSQRAAEIGETPCSAKAAEVSA